MKHGLIEHNVHMHNGLISIALRQYVCLYVRHGPKPGSHEAEAEAFTKLEAEALTLINLEAEALVTKPKPGYLY